MDYQKLQEWSKIAGHRIAQLFVMDEETWKHYANPWSFWTRLLCFPLLILAIYARVWWGISSWVIVVIAMTWTWLNPRIFPAPRTSKNWSSFATFGERVWLNRKVVPIPKDQRRVIGSLTFLMFVNVFPLAYGLIDLDLPFVVFPMILQLVVKLWFYDRMVWLYTHMQCTNPTYASWIY